MDKAIFELSEKLRHPSDIRTKLRSIEEDTREKYEAHETKFKTKLMSGYSRISRMSDHIGDLNKKLSDFNISKNKSTALLKDFTILIKDYRTVKTICEAHQNFNKIKDFMENLKNIDSNVKDDDIETYHTNVFEKEEFACELELYNYDLEKDDFSRVELSINKIKKISLEFTIILVEIISEFIENHEILKKINKIILKEETRDQLTKKAHVGEKGKDPELHQISKMYPKYITRQPKGLRLKLVNALRSAIREKFSTINTEEVFINRLGFVLSDLNCIYRNIDLDFFSFDDFLNEYHRNLKDLIDKTVNRLDAGEILSLIEFKTEYYNTIEARYNKVGEALGGGRLLENESELLEKYSRTASSKLKSWIENITAIELEKFHSRDVELSRDEENKLISSGFISLLQIVKAQLEPISFNKQVFLHITGTVKIHCEAFKNAILLEVEKDFRLACQCKSKPGFEDYCIMFGNSGLKLTQYITSLPQCQSPEVRELGNIFIDILKSCNYYLAEFVMFTCNPAIKKIFTDEWYNADSTRVLIVTIEDFLQDYSKMMSSFSFTTFIMEVCRAVCASLIKRCKSREIQLNDRTGGVLKNDYESLKGLFTEYAKEEDVNEALEPMLKLVPLFESSNEELIVLELKSQKLSNPQISSGIIKNIFSRRDNLDETMKMRLLDAIKEVFGKESTRKKGKNFISKFLP